MLKKIRVNTGNSKVVNGKLFISGLKAVQVSKSKVLGDLINYGSSITFPNLGKLVEYNGSYIRGKSQFFIYIFLLFNFHQIARKGFWWRN